MAIGSLLPPWKSFRILKRKLLDKPYAAITNATERIRQHKPKGVSATERIQQYKPKGESATEWIQQHKPKGGSTTERIQQHKPIAENAFEQRHKFV